MAGTPAGLGRATSELACAVRGASGALTEEYRPLLDALSALVSANEAAGSLAPGTTTGDVLLLLCPLWHVGPQDDDRARAERLVDVLMRGLCTPVTANTG
ncbi:hypothetical protein [Streptomyces sp. NPDC051286]|uniref:SbtR family transcriptional regulator n=1 Tax=Streptomyces sp. NPDC051286 TaxID=3365647 RepID=UPI0037A9A324